MTDAVDISVLIPAYNEALSLEELFKRIDSVLKETGQSYEFILVDDGSSDNTTEIVRSLKQTYKNFIYLKNRTNCGKSIALMQGFDHANGEILITMDADLQDQPENIPAFLEALKGEYDLVNGWRSNRKDTSSKRLVSKIYNWITNKILMCPIHDINCGFKAMRRDVYKSIQLRGDLHRLVPALAVSKGFKVGEVEVDHEDRKHGTSRYKLLRHRGILDVVIVAASQSTQNRPFHLFFETAFFIGLSFVLFSALWLTSLANDWEAGVWIFGVLAVWALFTATILPLFGFMLEAILMSRREDREWNKSLLVKDPLS